MRGMLGAARAERQGGALQLPGAVGAMLSRVAVEAGAQEHAVRVVMPELIGLLFGGRLASGLGDAGGGYGVLPFKNVFEG